MCRPELRVRIAHTCRDGEPNVYMGLGLKRLGKTEDVEKAKGFEGCLTINNSKTELNN